MPIWVSLPMAFVLMVAVASHAGATYRSCQPPSRKRIRLANAALSLLLLPLLVAGFSLLDADRQPREWTLVWMASFILLALVVGLAMLDVLNTVRLARGASARLRRALAASTRTPPRDDQRGRQVNRKGSGRADAH